MDNSHPERNFEKAQHTASAATLGQCPPDEGREVAFAGRSNAGKSSALNALTRNSKLARTSKTPGRTRLFNFFSLGEQARLVDLPGYGFAKVPASVKAQWVQQIDSYLRQRRSLAGLILVMDIRHPLTEFDRRMLQWAKACDMPVHVLLTKADKLKKAPRLRQLQLVRSQLRDLSDDVSVQLFSALARSGVDDLARTLLRWLDLDPGEAPLSGIPPLDEMDEHKKKRPATQGRE